MGATLQWISLIGEPSTFDEHDLIFVYQIPPKPGSLTSYLLEKAKE
jgi:hypothetical protein